MLHNAGKRITDYDIAAIFNTAYVSAATLDKGVKGFDCTGIYPFNRNRIPEYRYAPSATTDNSATYESASMTTPTLSFQIGSEDIIFEPPTIGEELIVELHGLHNISIFQ